jgi:hypothetical protein
MGSDDVIEWQVKDGEQIVTQGVFGFPMSGAIPAVVLDQYWQRIRPFNGIFGKDSGI